MYPTFEAMAVEGELRLYSISTTIVVCFAHGNSTPRAFEMMGLASNDLAFAKVAALGLIVAGLGSAVINGAALAPPRRRSSIVWGMLQKKILVERVGLVDEKYKGIQTKNIHTVILTSIGHDIIFFYQPFA